MRKRLLIPAILLAVCLVITGCNAADNTTSTSGADEDIATLEATEFDAVTIFETDEYSAYVTEVEGEGADTVITVKYKNDSEEDLQFYASYGAVNGVSCSVSEATTVSAGVSLTSEISLASSGLSVDFDEYSDIYIEFNVCGEDYEDYDASNIHIYPYGEDSAVVYSREEEETDIVLASSKQASITLISTQTEDGEHQVLFYLENNTDSTIMFLADDVEVNGYSADPGYSEVVSANSVCFSTMSWSEEDLPVTIDTITLTIKAYNETEGTLEYYINEDVTIDF